MSEDKTKQWTPAQQQAVKEKEKMISNKLRVKLGEFVCWLVMMYGLSDIFGLGFVALGIQWLKVNDVSITFLGFAGLVALAIIDRFIDKLYERTSKND
jgi:hypothetical protein